MTARSRVLGGLRSAPPQQSTPPTIGTLDSDFVVIVAALLCALICVVGLAVVARCAWIRRIAVRDSSNKGLKKKVLKSLPKSTYGDSSEQAATLSDCAICLSDFSAGEEIRVLPQCGHGFHVACIDTWLGCHSSCPSCRQILHVARCQRCGSLPATACAAAVARTQPIDIHGNFFLV